MVETYGTTVDLNLPLMTVISQNEIDKTQYNATVAFVI